MTFTKERIEQFINNPIEHGLTRGEQMEMARQLLAGMEQDPVYQACKEAGVWVDIDPASVISLRANGEQVRALYAVPQLPQPEVPDEMEDNGNPHDEENQAYVGGWNACRAAMLHGAEPPAYEIKGFGMFNATSLDLDGRKLATSIQCFHFERGTVPEHVFNQGIVVKHALQAIINALQLECDGMDDAPVPQIWPMAPKQEAE